MDPTASFNALTGTGDGALDQLEAAMVNYVLISGNAGRNVAGTHVP